MSKSRHRQRFTDDEIEMLFREDATNGRSVQVRENGQASERLERKSVRQIAKKQESLSSRIERAEPVEAD
jgi:hypothetical protein